MSAKTPENVIISAIHGALAKYPEGDGGVHLDYQWMRPEHSSHVARKFCCCCVSRMLMKSNLMVPTDTKPRTTSLTHSAFS